MTMWICGWISLLLLFQTNPSEPDLRCGGYCLYVSLKGLGFPLVSYGELEERLGQPTVSGYSFAQLAEVACSYGAETLGVETTLENLRQREEAFACIAFLEPAHFVTVAKVDDREVHVIDPPRDYSVPVETFESQWTGKALLIAATPLAPEESLNRRFPVWGVLTIAALVVVVSGVALVRRAKSA